MPPAAIPQGVFMLVAHISVWRFILKKVLCMVRNRKVLAPWFKVAPPSFRETEACNFAIVFLFTKREGNPLFVIS